MTLDEHLNACVRETNRLPSGTGARAALAAAIAADPALRAEAVEEMTRCRAVADRCFIARTKLAALEGVLRS